MVSWWLTEGYPLMLPANVLRTFRKLSILKFWERYLLTLSGLSANILLTLFCWVGWTVCNILNKLTKFYEDVYSFEPVRGCQFLRLYISMFEKWLESPQWLLVVSKPKVHMRVTSAWGQELARRTMNILWYMIMAFAWWSKQHRLVT